MRPGILPEHGFKHKGNHYASLPWFGTKIAQKYAIKESKFSDFRRDVKPHVLTFSTSGQRQSRSQSPRAFWSAPRPKGTWALGTRWSQRFVHAQCRLERNVTFPVAVVRPATSVA